MRIVRFIDSKFAVCRTLVGNIEQCICVAFLVLVPTEITAEFLKGHSIDDLSSHPHVAKQQSFTQAVTSGTTTTTAAPTRSW